MMFVWYLYCLGVCLSFLWFARPWLVHPERWHIGSMAGSYAVLVLFVGTLPFSELHNWQIVLLSVSMCFGLIGIGKYWVQWHGG